MPGFDGTGPNGMGPMTGGARGYCNPSARRFTWQPSRARRWTSYGFPRFGAYGPFVAGMNREQELELLKKQADVLRDELGEIEAEIGKLSQKENKEK